MKRITPQLSGKNPLVTNGFDPAYLRAASKEALELDLDAQTACMDMYRNINNYDRRMCRNLIRVTEWRINRIKCEMYRRGY